MAPDITDEMREQIISWRYEHHISIANIVSFAKCSERTVYTVLQHFCEYGVSKNPFSNPREPPRLLDFEDVNYIRFLITADPCIYLDEIQDKLSSNRFVEPSIATLSRTLRQVALTHKIVASEALERDEMLRDIWIAEHGSYPASHYVWLDESSVDDQTNQRRHGWAAIGRACVRRPSFIRGQRYSVLPALTSESMIALDVFEGSVNKERFIEIVIRDLVS